MKVNKKYYKKVILVLTVIAKNSRNKVKVKGMLSLTTAAICNYVFLCRKSQSVLYGAHQAAGRNNILDKRREWLRLIGLACGDIGDYARVKIHLDLIAVLDIFRRLFALENSQTDVEGIAVKYSGKCGGDHAGNARSLDGNRSVFS